MRRIDESMKNKQKYQSKPTGDYRTAGRVQYMCAYLIGKQNIVMQFSAASSLTTFYNDNTMKRVNIKQVPYFVVAVVVYTHIHNRWERQHSSTLKSQKLFAIHDTFANVFSTRMANNCRQFEYKYIKCSCRCDCLRLYNLIIVNI